jgi:ATP-dependent exoDNAse (exonuclease V) alpha subunit
MPEPATPEPDPRLFGISASNLERGELAAVANRKLVAGVKSQLAWLKSTPELTEQQRERLIRWCAALKEMNEQRRGQLAGQAETIAKLLALLRSDPNGQHAELFRAQAATLDALAASASSVAAIIELTAEIDRRLAGG